MRTSKEFFGRLQNDEAFAKEVESKVKAEIDAGETDINAVWIPIAAEYDYELTAEELDKMSEKQEESFPMKSSVTVAEVASDVRKEIKTEG